MVNVFYAPQAKGGATRVVIDNIRDMRALYPEEFEFTTQTPGGIGDPVEKGVNGHIVSVDDFIGLIAVIRRIDADPARYLASPPPGRSMRTSRNQAKDLAVVRSSAGVAASADGG